MIAEKIEIINAAGLHARPSTKLAQIAGKYSATITVNNGTEDVDAASVIALMMLAAVQGTILKISADGDDESEALAEVVALFNDGFGEM